MASKPELPKTNRREMLKLGLGAAALAGCSRKYLAAKSHQSKRPLGGRPNILMLMADQHRGDCIGADGNKAIHTPNLDWLAQDGALFSRAYTATPSCTPARAGLLTGLSPWNHGMLGYYRVAEEYPLEMVRTIRNAGYYTTGIGKMHWHPQRNDHGFHRVLLDESGRVEAPEFISDYRCWFASEAPNLDPDATGIGFNDYRSCAYVLPERLHPTSWTGMAAVNFIDSYQRTEPFFLKVSFARPHSPYDPPQRFMDRYRDANLPQAHVGSWADRYAPIDEKNGHNLWHGDLGPEQVRASRQGYYGSVSFIDEQIGNILEALDRQGMLDNTLIVYCSDHGDMTGDHNLWRKTYAYEASARIPMLVRWPKGLLSVKRGQVLNQPVELRDIFPTFMDAAGTSVDAELDGQSLFHCIRGNAEGWRPYIDFEHDVCYGRENHWNALTDGHTKYIFHALDGEEQLFDIDNDPGELRDLAGYAEHEAELRKWRNRMIEHLQVRGEEFVDHGRLALRPERMLTSPNYPGAKKA